MTWNYRIIRTVSRHALTEPEEEFYDIHEVYYAEDGSPNFVSENPIAIWGLTLQELKNDLVYYSDAFDLPVLEMSYFDELKMKSSVGDLGGPLGDGDFYPTHEKIMRNNPAV